MGVKGSKKLSGNSAKICAEEDKKCNVKKLWMTLKRSSENFEGIKQFVSPFLKGGSGSVYWYTNVLMY